MLDIENLLKIQEKHPLTAYMNLLDEKKVARRLSRIYEACPVNNCDKCADCCFSSPEVYFIEFLNIIRNIRDSLDDETKKHLAKKIIKYELLNIATLELKCPFLDNNLCLIYDSRPIQCHYFPHYPEQDYIEMRESSNKRNNQIIQYFCLNHSLKLPEDVVFFDIAQCGKNIGSNGEKPVTLAAPERNMILQRIDDLQSETIPYQLDKEDAYSRFSHLFSQIYFTNDELKQMQIKGVKELLEKGTMSAVDNFIKNVTFVV